MKSTSRINLAIVGACFILLLTGMFSTGIYASPGSATAAAAPLKDEAAMPVVLIDQGHVNSHLEDYAAFAGDGVKLSSNLTEWGYEVRFLTGSLTASNLAEVDILLASFWSGSTSYTASELAALKTWFDSGNKSMWIAGDSDFDDTPGKGAVIPNAILMEVGSHALVAKGSIESSDNFGAAYRVKASVYNTEDMIPSQLLATSPHGGAEFHGPASVIGYNDSAPAAESLVKLESQEAKDYFKTKNLYWVIASTNNATHDSTMIYNTPETNYSLHDDNAQDNFIMMTAEEKVGADNSGKIVVTGESPWTTYKEMFNDPGEHGIPQDQYYIVKEVFKWFSDPGYEATCESLIILPTNGSTTSVSVAIFEGIVKGDTVSSLKIYLNGDLERTLTRSYAKEELPFMAGTNNLTIVAQSAEGLISTPATVIFTYAPEETQADGDDGIPGFELAIVVLAFSLVSLALKRRTR